VTETKKSKCIAAIRIRGTISARRETRETLQMLHLTRNNYAVLVDDRPSFLGMLKAAQNYVTWGEPSEDTVDALIKSRGRLLGNKKITEEYLQRIGFKTIEELAKSVFNSDTEYWKLEGIQPVFKSRPPSKGYKGNIKKGYRAGGELGYRGEKINELIMRMV
jgi:large subunit ribosomal protein L30